MCTFTSAHTYNRCLENVVEVLREVAQRRGGVRGERSGEVRRGERLAHDASSSLREKAEGRSIREAGQRGGAFRSST